MADEKSKGKKPEDKKKEEAKPAQGEAQAPAAAAPAKSKKMIFIAGGVVLLLMAIGTPLIIMSLGSGDKDKKDADITEVVEEVPEDGTLEGAEEQDELDENEAPLGAMFPMESFVVNLSGGRYIRAQVQLEFVDRDVPARFYTRLVPIRDAMIRLLASRSAEDLAEADGYDTLKSDVRELINTILKHEDVKNVYFTQFVVQ